MEVQDFIYNQNYSAFEKRRISLLGMDEEYSKAVDQNLKFRETCFEQAQEILSKKLNIDSEVFRYIIEGINDKSKFIQTLEKIRVFYPKNVLPTVDKETVKNAYLFYLNDMIILLKENSKNIELAKIRSELEEIVKWLYYQNKMVLHDTLKKKFGIEEKYFTQLIKHYQLLEDKEISEKLEIIKDLSSDCN